MIFYELCIIRSRFEFDHWITIFRFIYYISLLRE